MLAIAVMKVERSEWNPTLGTLRQLCYTLYYTKNRRGEDGPGGKVKDR